MGKKSKRHTAHAGAAKPAAGSLINNKTVCKIVDELWTKTQGQASTSPSGLWKEYDEIVALTASLKEKQGPSPSRLPAREEGFEAFYDWLRAGKAEFDKVEVGLFGGVGYGVKAKADVNVGERVMRIPENLMMTSETAKACQLGPLIARDRMLQVMPNVALALHLLNERYNPKSSWKPYIDILPASFSLPLWFNKSQLELLQGSPCLTDALQHVRSVGKLYCHLHKLLRAHGDTSFYLYSVGFYYEDFVWAVSSVMSRQNEIPHPKDDKQSLLALIPLWDMCNHWLGTISTDFNTEMRTCDCFSPNAVKAGKELRIFYGARSNAELFLHQGFVYPPNTGDSLRIKMGLSSGEDPATKALKSKLLTKLDIPLSGIFHILAAEEPFDPQLKAFVRVFTAKADDLKHYVSLEDVALKTELMAEKWRPEDVSALQFLIQRCELLLKTYRSSMFEDFEKVTRTKVDDKTHQALMLTICERCILGSAVKMATSSLVALQCGEDGMANDPVEQTEKEEKGDPMAARKEESLLPVEMQCDGERNTDTEGATKIETVATMKEESVPQVKEEETMQSVQRNCETEGETMATKEDPVVRFKEERKLSGATQGREQGEEVNGLSTRELGVAGENLPMCSKRQEGKEEETEREWQRSGGGEGKYGERGESGKDNLEDGGKKEEGQRENDAHGRTGGGEVSIGSKSESDMEGGRSGGRASAMGVQATAGIKTTFQELSMPNSGQVEDGRTT